jgi:hypothetical protein
VAEVSSSDQGWLLDISCADSSRRIRLTDPSTAAQEERLRWCMEDHAVLEPFNTSRCQESLEELKTYGRHLYDQLQIESLISGHSDISNVILNVAGTGGKPNVHLLHWEVLEDPILWPGGAETPWHIAVRRSFRSAPVIDKRIKASFNILYVVARPTKVNYIEYRLLSRRLLQIIDRINRDAMDVQLHILRPGTWGALVSYLDSIRQLKGMRHTDLVHFDMHGSLEVVNGREE